MSTARISKIARRAGVSEATVSRVLNNKPNVAAATRQAVLDSADVLGMEAARSTLRSGRLIGLIIPELSNPIFPALAQVIEQALSGRGYTPVLCTQTAGGSTEDGLVEMLVGQGVAGIVFVSGLHANADADTGRYEKLAERRIPFILINGFNEKISAPFISPDDRAAMRMAVQHLVQLGHERIGLAVGQQRFVPVKRKVEGFIAALQQLLGRSAEESQKFIHHTLFTVEGGHAAGDVLLERGCTAIVCGSDMMALGAVRAVRERGLHVPEHVSVVGFDGSPLMAFTEPKLTTIRQPVEAMAAAAVDTLLEELKEGSALRGELLFHPELVVRGSTAASWTSRNLS